MDRQTIDTRLVYGFLDAGKTTYIQDCLFNDYFYKRGKTLILCFEEGEEEYDEEALSLKNARVMFYDDSMDITGFCSKAIEEYEPDRIYVEMNTMMEGLRENLPDIMRVTYAVTWIDWTTLELYFNNFKKMISQMVMESNQITFRGCTSKELLAPYSQAFRAMNHRASYLRQDPMGYHEKAFDIFLPFSLEQTDITITEKEYLPLWLDAADHPEHYTGKTLSFKDPLELKHIEGKRFPSAGRIVMTCCMADLQFMAFELMEGIVKCPDSGWMTFEAQAYAGADEYGRKVLKLSPTAFHLAPAPSDPILSVV